ncbi:hypothetical protein HGRIS_002341 [Hohenbuehelia grisea]|uniref:Uncharacterized protein n=1 Tax=Hohenbuehelia grisea TaxID=104357 RepID=A0ABR3JKX2_9AGAR
MICFVRNQTFLLASIVLVSTGMQILAAPIQYRRSVDLSTPALVSAVSRSVDDTVSSSKRQDLQDIFSEASPSKDDDPDSEDDIKDDPEGDKLKDDDSDDVDEDGAKTSSPSKSEAKPELEHPEKDAGISGLIGSLMATLSGDDGSGSKGNQNDKISSLLDGICPTQGQGDKQSKKDDDDDSDDEDRKATPTRPDTKASCFQTTVLLSYGTTVTHYLPEPTQSQSSASSSTDSSSRPSTPSATDSVVITFPGRPLSTSTLQSSSSEDSGSASSASTTTSTSSTPTDDESEDKPTAVSSGEPPELTPPPSTGSSQDDKSDSDDEDDLESLLSQFRDPDEDASKTSSVPPSSTGLPEGPPKDDSDQSDDPEDDTNDVDEDSLPSPSAPERLSLPTNSPTNSSTQSAEASVPTDLLSLLRGQGGDDGEKGGDGDPDEDGRDDEVAKFIGSLNGVDTEPGSKPQGSDDDDDSNPSRPLTSSNGTSSESPAQGGLGSKEPGRTGSQDDSLGDRNGKNLLGSVGNDDDDDTSSGDDGGVAGLLSSLQGSSTEVGTASPTTTSTSSSTSESSSTLSAPASILTESPTASKGSPDDDDDDDLPKDKPPVSVIGTSMVPATATFTTDASTPSRIKKIKITIEKDL